MGVRKIVFTRVPLDSTIFREKIEGLREVYT